jgi:hypothetical protein
LSVRKYMFPSCPEIAAIPAIIFTLGIKKVV